MKDGPSSPQTARRAELLALANELRPELHRFCARLMGSVIDGEDAKCRFLVDSVEKLKNGVELTNRNGSVATSIRQYNAL